MSYFGVRLVSGSAMCVLLLYSGLFTIQCGIL